MDGFAMITRSTLRRAALMTFLGLGLAVAPVQAQNGAWMGVVQAGGGLLVAVGNAAGSQELVEVGQALQQFGSVATNVIQQTTALQGGGTFSGTTSVTGSTDPFNGVTDTVSGFTDTVSGVTDTASSVTFASDAVGDVADVFGTTLTTSEVADAAVGDSAFDPEGEGLDLTDGPGR
jgi:hypothetical protein